MLGKMHEAIAWALLAVISLHLAGLVWHTIRHRENISTAMVTGKKEGKREDAISSSHGVWGVVMAILAWTWIAALFASHDAQTATVRLPGIGLTLRLGENEPSEGNHERGQEDD